MKNRQKDISLSLRISFYYYIITTLVKSPGRTSESRYFSQVEKNVIFDTIKEYSLFNMQDKETQEIVSRRLKRNIFEDTFRRVKK